MDWKTNQTTDARQAATSLPRGSGKRQQCWNPIKNPVVERENANPEVIIIGNGPSAICLSYLLSGNWPFYTGREDATIDIDESLQTRLQNISHDLSLVEQDLSHLSSGLEGRSPNPVALLFDILANPGADIGARLPSLLRWHFFPGKEVPHLVLGRKQVGGVWQNQNEKESEGRTKTVSLGSWMELPGMSLKDWLDERNSKSRQTNSGDAFRASMADISGYYREYVRRQNLSQYFRNYSTVTSLNRLTTTVGPRSFNRESGEVELGFDSQPPREDASWEVCGYRTTHDELGEERSEEFRYTAPNVVLATGAFDVPLSLCVPGENHPYVVHSFHDFERRLEKRLASSADPVVVIGGGLTAADAILMLRERKIPTIHIHRRGKDAGVYQQLVPKIYPEYHDVYRLMNADSTPEWYSAYSSVDILSFTAEHDVILRCQTTGSETTVRASLVAVLVGSRPDLSFVCPSVLKDLGITRSTPVDGKRNFVDVRPSSYESVHHAGLYAMGPLVGDKMVRFIRGGGLAIASHIWSKRQKSGKTTE